MTSVSCAVDGCELPIIAKGYCGGHYQRVRKTGRPGAAQLQVKYKDPEESFAARTEWQGDHLIWTASTNGVGYGLIRTGKTILAHRYSYIRTYGPIPEGIVIDHICHIPRCVNPEHLRAVTVKQNNEHTTKPDRGVYWDEAGRRWVARVSHNYKLVYNRSFTTKSEAVEAARQARLEHYTHNDHDRAA